MKRYLAGAKAPLLARRGSSFSRREDKRGAAAGPTPLNKDLIRSSTALTSSTLAVRDDRVRDRDGVRREHAPTGGAANGRSSAPVDLSASPALDAFRYKGCGWAWTCLAVGNVEEASRASVAEDDLVCYAAALAMSGEPGRALLVLEAYVVGICAGCYEVLGRPRGRSAPDGPAHRYQKAVMEWLQLRIGPNTHLRDAEYRKVIQQVVALVDWRTVLRWYVIALTLLGAEDSVEPYKAPRNAWLRYFFALFPDGVPRTSATALSRGGGIPTHLEELDAGETLSLLLGQCDEAEVQFVTAVTALRTQHYRSAMGFATRTLELALGALEGGGGLKSETTPARHYSSRRCAVWRDAVAMRYVRCCAALEVGERAQATVDILGLLQQQLHHGGTAAAPAGASPVPAREAAYVSSVGLALALYGVPLPEAREPVLSTLEDSSYSLLARRHLLLLAIYVHTLTLLHLGQLEASASIASRVIASTRGCVSGGGLVRDRLADVVVRCGVGLEDSTLVLETPLCPHRLLYLALSPGFFGGLSRDGIRLHRHTDTFTLLYPSTFSSYMPVRQMLAFHMNRAFYFFSHGNYMDAWDDVCCAVAGADEIVGSAEFAFTECFPLRVYFFGCQVALVLLEMLFHEEVGAFAACLHAEEEGSQSEVLGEQLPLLLSPLATAEVVGRVASARSLVGSGRPAEHEEALVKAKERVYAENDALAREVIALSRQWTRQIQLYYPHSMLGDLAQVRVAVMTLERDMLTQAVALSRRYPNSPLAQNTLTLALYFGHNTSEAVDTAQKNFEDFPHARDVMEVYRWLQREKMVYVFHYRTLVPLRYRVGDGTRVFTKRMLIAVVLLLFNFSVVLLTCVLNLPQLISVPERMRNVAVRLQLPSLIPLYFATVILVHAVIAATSSANLIHTFLCDNHFCNTPLSRFLFSLRGMALVNVVNALQISLAGNNFLFESAWYTSLLYLVLTCMFVPFTTRVWFLPSVDEPHVGVLSWLTLLCVDTVIAFVIVVPHIVLAALEPLLCLVYYCYLPPTRPTEHAVSGSVRRRLLYHEQNRYAMPGRFSVGSGSRFLHVRALSFLYRGSHSARETANLDAAQLDAEGYRAFPLISPASVGVDTDRLMDGAPASGAAAAHRHSHPSLLGRRSHAAGRAEAGDGEEGWGGAAGGAEADDAPPGPRREGMPGNEPLLQDCDPALLHAILQSAGDDGGMGGAVPVVGSVRGYVASDAAVHRSRERAPHEAPPAHVRGRVAPDERAHPDEEQRSTTGSPTGAGIVRALSRTSFRASFSNREQFQHTGTDAERLVDMVQRALLPTPSTAGSPTDTLGGTARATLRRSVASFAVHAPLSNAGSRAALKSGTAASRSVMREAPVAAATGMQTALSMSVPRGFSLDGVPEVESQAGSSPTHSECVEAGWGLFSDDVDGAPPGAGSAPAPMHIGATAGLPVVLDTGGCSSIGGPPEAPPILPFAQWAGGRASVVHRRSLPPGERAHGPLPPSQTAAPGAGARRGGRCRSPEGELLSAVVGVAPVMVRAPTASSGTAPTTAAEEAAGAGGGQRYRNPLQSPPLPTRLPSHAEVVEPAGVLAGERPRFSPATARVGRRAVRAPSSSAPREPEQSAGMPSLGQTVPTHRGGRGAVDGDSFYRNLHAFSHDLEGGSYWAGGAATMTEGQTRGCGAEVSAFSTPASHYLGAARSQTTASPSPQQQQLSCTHSLRAGVVPMGSHPPHRSPPRAPVVNGGSPDSHELPTLPAHSGAGSGAARLPPPSHSPPSDAFSYGLYSSSYGQDSSGSDDDIRI